MPPLPDFSQTINHLIQMNTNKQIGMKDWFVGGLSLCRVAPPGTAILPAINPEALLVASTLAEVTIDDLQLVTVSFSLRLPPEFRKLTPDDLQRRSRNRLSSAAPQLSLRPLSNSLRDRITLRA